jgi:hypothetical protein
MAVGFGWESPQTFGALVRNAPEIFFAIALVAGVRDQPVALADDHRDGVQR